MEDMKASWELSQSQMKLEITKANEAIAKANQDLKIEKQEKIYQQQCISQEKAQSDKLKDTLAKVSLERAQKEEVIKTMEKNQSGQKQEIEGLRVELEDKRSKFTMLQEQQSRWENCQSEMESTINVLEKQLEDEGKKHDLESEKKEKICQQQCVPQEKAQSDKLKDFFIAKQRELDLVVNQLAQVSLERAQQEEVFKTMEKTQSSQKPEIEGLRVELEDKRSKLTVLQEQPSRWEKCQSEMESTIIVLKKQLKDESKKMEDMKAS